MALLIVLIVLSNANDWAVPTWIWWFLGVESFIEVLGALRSSE